MKFLPRFILVFFLLGKVAGESLPSPESAMEKIKLHQDYLGALAELKVLLDVPNPPVILYYLTGVCQTSLRNYRSAIKHFQTAREKGLNSWELKLSLGVAYARIGQGIKARRELEMVLQFQPEEPTALFHLGELDFKSGLYPDAELNFRKVLRLNPGHANILFNLGNSLLRQGKENEARAFLQKHRKTAHLRGRLKTLRWMSASSQAGAEVFSELGDTNLEIGDQQRAIEAYTRAETLEPDTHLTRLGRGKLAYYKGHLLETIHHLRYYLDKGGSNCEVFLFLSLARRKRQEHEAARDAIGKGLDLCPQNIRLLSTSAKLEMERGQLDQTVVLAERIIQADSRNPSGPFIKGLARLYQKRLNEAEMHALKALHLNNQDPNHHKLLQKIYQHTGKPDKARFHEEKAMALSETRKFE